MKKIILLFILILCFGNIFKIAAQCWNGINTITTKWDATNTSNKEKWDWTIPGNAHNVYLRDNLDAPTFVFELPYFCSKPGGSGSCNNINTYPYEMLLPSEQDIYPENGWELVLKDFGSPNSAPGKFDGQGTPNPIFILYNKYTGKMKVYLAVIGNKEANSAYLEIKFNYDKSNPLSAKRGVFAHANAIAKTLVEFDEDAKFQSLNDYAIQNFEDDYYWLVSEIQTAYDPCTCYDPKFTSIEVRPWLIEASVIEAKIEGQMVQQLMDANGVNKSADGTTSFKDLAKSSVQAAIKGYSDFTSYKNQMDDMLNKGSAEYRNKLVTEWFEEYVKKNPQYQGVNNLPAKYALWDALGRTDDEFKKSIGMEKIDAYDNGDLSNYKFLKSVASFVPYVGSAIGVIDFLVSGGKQTEPPKPSPPMVFNVSLTLNGSIVNPKIITSFIQPTWL